MSEAAWETAMGMRGYAGSPAEREARAVAKKPDRPKGHKFAGCQYLVKTQCECGWQSSGWIGKGARANAYGEWHMHIENCQKRASS